MAPPTYSGRRVAVGPTGTVSVVGWIYTYTQTPTDVTFLARYTSTGEKVWIHRFPRDSNDAPGEVIAAGPGDHLWSSAPVGEWPSTRARVSRYDVNGEAVWSLEFGDVSTTWTIGDLVVDGAGDAYVGGDTIFPGASEGDTDAFVAKISPDGVLQ
ncbi:hypothetical protein [Anaeromyxobacter sp. SG17]|uniref:hypothetical protein n=1 Tax=Anaeromyxobacter sp. SG17 TaxID=2925405 RepID=UPI001F59DCD8|nr:hypothetical protein [Anaeromyxobacter sp. SG17]